MTLDLRAGVRALAVSLLLFGRPRSADAGWTAGNPLYLVQSAAWATSPSDLVALIPTIWPASVMSKATDVESRLRLGRTLRLVNGNPRIRMLRTEKTNDPGLIASHPQLVSVNSALEVDLFARANASRIGRRVYSGFGGADRLHRRRVALRRRAGHHRSGLMASARGYLDRGAAALPAR